jgi:hypothetical protein
VSRSSKSAFISKFWASRPDGPSGVTSPAGLHVKTSHARMHLGQTWLGNPSGPLRYALTRSGIRSMSVKSDRVYPSGGLAARLGREGIRITSITIVNPLIPQVRRISNTHFRVSFEYRLASESRASKSSPSSNGLVELSFSSSSHGSSWLD